MSTVAFAAAALQARVRSGRAASGVTRALPGADETSRSTRRIALASMIGTTIEYYDYLIFGTAAALVFGQVFFPQLGGATGALAALASLAVAFIFRPIGSVLFGHIGDRLGRKSTLIITLLLMGLSTVAVGLLPSAATIGVAAPILLVLFRAFQGLAVGGRGVVRRGERSCAPARAVRRISPARHDRGVRPGEPHVPGHLFDRR